MTLSPEENDVLLALLRELTPGHVSTLVASLNEPDSRIGTSTDSKNYAFLQRLVDLGLAKEAPVEMDMPPELEAVLKLVSINEEAKPAVAELLESAFPNTGQDT